MGSIPPVLRAAVVVIAVICYVVVAGAITIPLSLLTGRAGFVYGAGRMGVRLALWLAGARTVVEGRPNLHPGEPCVYVCNHVSNAEPLAAVAVLPRIVALGKAGLWRIPILGTALRIVSFIPVERGTERAARAADVGVQRLKEGFSVLSFPEGTRSRTGELLPFRHGTFLMAIRAGVPIVPITALGAREIMPKGKAGIRPGTVRLVVHPPVPTRGLKEEDRAALADRVQQIIASAFSQAREPVAAQPPSG